jgi:hypothetical protein
MKVLREEVGKDANTTGKRIVCVYRYFQKAQVLSFEERYSNLS